MNAYHTETVETPAGEYAIELFCDERAENPLIEWAHEGMAFWVNYDSTRYIETDTLDNLREDQRPNVYMPRHDAGSALREFVRLDSDQDAVLRRYGKWRAITGSPWMLIAGDGSSSQSDYYKWFALIDTSQTWTASNGREYPLFLHPERTARGTMDSYRMWAAGEVCGYVVTAPDGREVDACWGFYDNDDALGEAREAISHDADKRIEAANRVGAGLVGIA